MDFQAACYLDRDLGQKNLEERPAFGEYVDRLQSRPAAVRANELDDALLPPVAAEATKGA